MGQKTIAAAVLMMSVLVGSGCSGGDGGQTDKVMASGGVGGAAAAAGIGGAGAGTLHGVGGPPTSGAVVDQYAGTWRYVSGTATSVCGADSQTTVKSGTLRLGKGIDSDLVQISNSCSIAFSLASGSAMVHEGQTCFAANGTDSVELRYRAWTFATSDGRTMTENGSATVTYETSTGRITCDLTVNATLTKVAQ